MQSFKEPKPNSIITTLCKFILPFWLRFREQLSITVRGNHADLQAFTKNRRAVVLLNHPDRQDPFVIVELAVQMREEFYCIAARECFDWDGGWRGRLFQSLGCYSVMRGKVDFHSIATTKKILHDGQRKLVVFPEAEITADEKNLHDLQKAIFHIALDVQKELSEGDTTDTEHPLVIIPAAIKFSLHDDLSSAVGPALRDIEKRLDLKQKTQNVHARINLVVNAYLNRVFESYGIEKPEASLEELAEFAAVHMLRTIASRIDLDCDDALTSTDLLYAVRNQANGSSQTDSIALRQAFHCAGMAKPCIAADLERVERLLILHRMLIHRSSDIQCCRILDFIESELTGFITPKGRQSCVVSIGTPIDVSSFVDLYIESKEEGTNSLSEHCERKLNDMLSKLSRIESVPHAQLTNYK